MLEQTQEQIENDLKINLSDMAIQGDIKGTIMSLYWANFELCRFHLKYTIP